MLCIDVHIDHGEWYSRWVMWCNWLRLRWNSIVVQQWVAECGPTMCCHAMPSQAILLINALVRVLHSNASNNIPARCWHQVWFLLNLPRLHTAASGAMGRVVLAAPVDMRCSVYARAQSGTTLCTTLYTSHNVPLLLGGAPEPVCCQSWWMPCLAWADTPVGRL